MKDCFGLHGHSAFGSVANMKIGVGGKSATSVGLTTDLVYWLQVGKTVDILRCAAKSTDASGTDTKDEYYSTSSTNTDF